MVAKAVLKTLRDAVKRKEYMTTQEIKMYQRLAEQERLNAKENFNTKKVK